MHGTLSKLSTHDRCLPALELRLSALPSSPSCALFGIMPLGVARSISFSVHAQAHARPCLVISPIARDGTDTPHYACAPPHVLRFHLADGISTVPECRSRCCAPSAHASRGVLQIACLPGLALQPGPGGPQLPRMRVHAWCSSALRLRDRICPVHHGAGAPRIHPGMLPLQAAAVQRGAQLQQHRAHAACTARCWPCGSEPVLALGMDMIKLHL